MNDRDILYMRRALHLAKKGKGSVSTNPMVGAVIVADGRIIGEGYHHNYGGAHAEVNAIGSVLPKDEVLLRQAVLYVTLEPCCHYGKTPPCTSLIIDKGIPRVVVSMVDPFAAVAGEGINVLRRSGVDVQLGVLAAESEWLNRRFVTYHTLHRPYIILKWAESADGFIDSDRECSEPPLWLTGYSAKVLVHRWRSEEDAIMVGANSVVRDNPQLTVREWYGRNPLRVTIDSQCTLSREAAIFDSSAPTVCYDTDDIEAIISDLYVRRVQSIIIEGGTKTLQRFIDLSLYDEVRRFISPITFGSGVNAPHKERCEIVSSEMVGTSLLEISLPIKIDSSMC